MQLAPTPKPAINSAVIKEVFAAHIKATFGGRPAGDRKTIKGLTMKAIEQAIECAEYEGLKIKLNSRKNLHDAEAHVLNVLVDVFDFPHPYGTYKSFLFKCVG